MPFYLWGGFGSLLPRSEHRRSRVNAPRTGHPRSLIVSTAAPFIEPLQRCLARARTALAAVASQFGHRGPGGRRASV
jgi:hypothetical protein